MVPGSMADTESVRERERESWNEREGGGRKIREGETVLCRIAR